MKTNDIKKAIDHLKSGGQVFINDQLINNITPLSFSVYWIKPLYSMSGKMYNNETFELK